MQFIAFDKKVLNVRWVLEYTRGQIYQLPLPLQPPSQVRVAVAYLRLGSGWWSCWWLADAERRQATATHPCVAGCKRGKSVIRRRRYHKFYTRKVCFLLECLLLQLELEWSMIRLADERNRWGVSISAHAAYLFFLFRCNKVFVMRTSVVCFE